jgi:hypothetical protein
MESGYRIFSGLRNVATHFDGFDVKVENRNMCVVQVMPVNHHEE